MLRRTGMVRVSAALLDSEDPNGRAYSCFPRLGDSGHYLSLNLSSNPVR